MIFYLVIGVTCGIIGYRIGVILATYWFMKDHGLLPGQQHYQSPQIMPGHQEE